MDAELLSIVKDTVATFRYGAPITTFDIRVAASWDGRPIDKYDNRSVGIALAEICDAKPGPYGSHDRRSFYRRRPE